jgi:hypothetical protein
VNTVLQVVNNLSALYRTQKVHYCVTNSQSLARIQRPPRSRTNTLYALISLLPLNATRPVNFSLSDLTDLIMYCAQSTPCTVHSPHCVLCTVHTVYCAQSTPCTVHSTHHVLCTVHTVYCAQYTPCTVHSPHRDALQCTDLSTLLPPPLLRAKYSLQHVLPSTFSL